MRGEHDGRPKDAAIGQERALSGVQRAVLALLTAAACVGLLFAPAVGAQEALVIKPLSEQRVTRLPTGPLFWRVETFPTLAAAQAAAGPTALVAESAGRIWLLTLGPRGGLTPGGTRVAEVGPLPIVPAAEYLLRVNEASGPPGSVTPVHTHPGSEGFYVLAGEQSIRTPGGTLRIAAGRTEAGPGSGTPLEVSSTGATDLLALVMFVVDAHHAFSSPATMPAGLPRTGGASEAALRALWAAGGLLALALGLAISGATRAVRRGRA
jgi:hypothetical protein